MSLYLYPENVRHYYSYTGCIKKGNPTLTGYLNVLNITFIGFLFRIYKDLGPVVYARGGGGGGCQGFDLIHT